MSRTAVVAIVAGAAGLTGLASGGAAATKLSDAALYFGKTNKGWSVQIDIRGQVLSKKSAIEGQLIHTCPSTMSCTKKHWPTDVISLNPYKDLSFKGDRLSYHFRDAAGHGEQWLELRREQGGRAITGWVRSLSHPPGYAPADSGKLRFTARLWASTSGAEWSGKTAAGRPLTMSVGYQPQSVNAPHPFSVAEFSRPLTCKDPSGAESTFQVTVPALEGTMVGGYFWSDPKYLFPAHTRSESPARGSATTEAGISLRATLSVAKLAPKGSVLVAVGSLKLEGTATGDAGSYPCEPLTTTFTLRPR